MEGSEKTYLPKIRFYDWVLSALCFGWFAATMLIFDIVQRISLLFGSTFHQKVVVIFQSRIVCFSGAFIGAKINVKKNFDLARDRPYIIISNHQSLADIPILSTIFHTHYPRFVAKKELAHWIPSVSINLRRGKSAIIDRSDTDQALEEIAKLGKRMRSKRFATVIFPEGTRARRGKLRSFRYAGAASLIQAVPEAAIIPVTIDGSWKLVAYGGYPMPSGVHIDVVVGQPLQHADYDGSKELIDAAYTVVSKTLAELRASKHA